MRGGDLLVCFEHKGPVPIELHFVDPIADRQLPGTESIYLFNEVDRGFLLRPFLHEVVSHWAGSSIIETSAFP